MQWETFFSIAGTLFLAAYTAGQLRQRIIELERRTQVMERLANDQAAALREIRDRVIAIDEWRKHVPVRRVRSTKEAAA